MLIRLKKKGILIKGSSKKKTKEKERKKRNSFVLNAKKHRSLSFKCLYMCLFDTNTSGFTEELTKASSTTANRWKKRGRKRQCY